MTAPLQISEDEALTLVDVGRAAERALGHTLRTIYWTCTRGAQETSRTPPRGPVIITSVTHEERGGIRINYHPAALAAAD